MGRCRNCLPGRGHQQYIGVVGCHIKLAVGELEQNGRAATTTCTTLGGNKTGGGLESPLRLLSHRGGPCRALCAGALCRCRRSVECRFLSRQHSAAPALFFLFSRDHVTAEVESG